MDIFPLLLLVLVIQSHPRQTEAKIFRNAYVSFKLPARWSCRLENTAWICRYAIDRRCIGKSKRAASKACGSQKKKTREAIIILAAKEVGPKDNLKAYYNHLMKTRPIVTRSGKRSTSKLIHSKVIKIQRHKWVDGMHQGSEIPHYYTRYLATVKGKVAVLVTFSAHKLFYTKYSSEFFRAIKSLRVIATKSSMVAGKNLRSKNVGTFGVNIGAHLNTAIDETNQGEDFDGSEGGADMNFYLMIGAGLLLLAGVFIWMRGKR